MKRALINAAAIVTMNTDGQHRKRGSQMNEPGLLTNSVLIIADSKIEGCYPADSFNPASVDEILDVSGKTILPGLIDCHTHTVFAGSRSHEFQMKLSGSTYEQIAASGGGISYTMKQTREATEKELVDLALERLQHYASLGVTTVEIKSGYGLDYENEIKMLHVIGALKKRSPLHIVPTFLGAHIIPPEYKNNRKSYIAMLCEQLIPHIASEGLAVFCDVFCEEGAYTADEMTTILGTAARHGLLPRAHVEQFHSIGGLQAALAMNAISVDHLEVISPEQITSLASSSTTAVALPGCSLFLKCPYAPARAIIDAGGTLAIATDFNPGSSHIQNLPLVLSIAALQMKLSINEVIAAATINAANALSASTITGSIEPGKQADLLVLDSGNYADLIYNIGKNSTYMTMINGKIIYSKENGV